MKLYGVALVHKPTTPHGVATSKLVLRTLALRPGPDFAGTISSNECLVNVSAGHAIYQEYSYSG